MENKKSNKRTNTVKNKGNVKNNKNRNSNNVKNTKNTKNTKTKQKKKMSVGKKILLILLLVILVAGGVFAYKTYKNGGGLSGMLATAVGHNEYTKKNLGEFRCLVLGISTDEEGALLTDTIMVASYNPNTQKATLLSIPRDTYTGNTPSRATAYEKINSVYSRHEDPQDVLDEVNEITGLNLEYYVIVKTEGFIKLVDAIGGVTFNVPIDMDYDDTSQDLHIHLKAGEQLLDGDKAEQLVRFRHNNDGTSYPEEYGDNDTGRMRTQREFIMAVIQQTAKVENIFKLGQILEVAQENVITNIDFNVAKDYIPYAVEFSTENLLTATLPGENTNKNAAGTWIFVHDEDETAALIQELFYDRDLEQPTEEGTENTTGNETNSTSNATGNQTSSSRVSKADIKLEVINGSGNSNKLQEVVNELEGAGYEVYRTGTTNSTSKTTIINKKDAADTILENIKTILGVGTISNSQSSSSKADVTIVIGRDYE